MDIRGFTRRQKVLSLKYMGYSVADISDVLQISTTMVQTDIDRAVSLSADSARIDMVREAEISKLEAIEQAFWPSLSDPGEDEHGNPILPSVDAGKMILAVMDRRSKLLGVDKIKPTEHTHTISLVAVLAEMSRSATMFDPQPADDLKVIDHER